MITAIVALAIAQQPSYFVATFPNPTGNNGWEEYTRALDLVRGLGARSALANGLVESRNLNSKTLDAVDLVRAGNRKPLVYPWKLDLIEIDDRNPSILFVDLGAVMIARARVLFADGRPGAAADALIDTIHFAHRISAPTSLNALYSGTIFSLALLELQRHLPKLDVASTRELASEFERLSRAQPPLILASIDEIDVGLAIVQPWLENRDYYHGFGVPEGFFEMTKTDREKYSQLITAKLRIAKQKLVDMLTSEERFWTADALPVDDDPIIDYALYYFVSSMTPQIAARYRTQFRLAVLHCRVMEFKRTYNRWPNALTELGGKEFWYDPASGGPFFYAKLTDQSYTLYSLGTSETGRIDLVWRPQR